MRSDNITSPSVVVSGRWMECLACLEDAATFPARREDSLRAALSVLGAKLSADGVALMRHGDGASGWKIDYVGEQELAFESCIFGCLHPGFRETAIELSRSNVNRGRVSVIRLEENDMSTPALLVLTGCDGADISGFVPCQIQHALSTLVAVEHLERNFTSASGLDLSSGMSHALSGSDGLAHMLALACDVSGADFTYWGNVREGIVDVEWNYGAKDSDFGFELPLGEGLGGRAFARGEAFEVLDYLNCQYRYPGVSEATDSEEVRTALAVPVRGGGSGAVLYAVKREVEAFSPPHLAMLMQIRNAIEPVFGGWKSPAKLYPCGLDHLRLQKSELRKLLLESDHVYDVELWLSRLSKGSAMVLDGSDHPYITSNLSYLEKLENESSSRRHDFVLPDGRASGGKLSVWTDMEMPPDGWLDLPEDVTTAIGVVIDRAEQAHERIGKQRSHWLRSVATGDAADDLRRDGTRLGLPVKGGEVWSFAWQTDHEQPRMWMISTDVLLDLLGEPLIPTGDGTGTVLLREPCRTDPSAVRDELLRHVGPAPLWLAHGATYESFECLRGALARATGAVTNLRRSQTDKFVTEVDGRDLDSLLGNPALTEDLDSFSEKLLSLLTDFDSSRNTRLTETFCRTLALGSPSAAAKELYVHSNTVRYRMRQASDILSANLDDPKERTALTLAAFVWLGKHG